MKFTSVIAIVSALTFTASALPISDVQHRSRHAINRLGGHPKNMMRPNFVHSHSKLSVEPASSNSMGSNRNSRSKHRSQDSHLSDEPYTPFYITSPTGDVTYNTNTDITTSWYNGIDGPLTINVIQGSNPMDMQPTDIFLRTDGKSGSYKWHIPENLPTGSYAFKYMFKHNGASSIVYSDQFKVVRSQPVETSSVSNDSHMSSNSNMPTDSRMSTPAPNTPSSGPNALSSGPNVSSPGPNVSSPGPNVSSSGPNVTSSGPNMSSSSSSMPSSGPNMSSSNSNVPSSSPNVSSSSSNMSTSSSNMSTSGSNMSTSGSNMPASNLNMSSSAPNMATFDPNMNVADPNILAFDSNMDAEASLASDPRYFTNTDLTSDSNMASFDPSAEADMASFDPNMAPDADMASFDPTMSAEMAGMSNVNPMQVATVSQQGPQ